jgi:hypothetical protein
MRSMSDYHDTIAEMRLKSKTGKQISQVTGFKVSSIYDYAKRHNLPRNNISSLVLASVPYGRVSLRRLSSDEIIALDKYASKHKHTTLADAAMQIIRQALK